MWWKRTLVTLVVIAIFTSLFAHAGMFGNVLGGQKASATEVQEVPHYFQTDYPDTPYGRHGDTVATDGCGITSLAMV